jgi:hypothetical protein
MIPAGKTWERAMPNNARYLSRLSLYELMAPHRFSRRTMRFAVLAVGAVAAVAVAYARSGPIKAIEPALVSGAFAPPAATSINDPSPFGYLEFDWAGPIPGFDGTNPPPDDVAGRRR